MKLDWKRLDLKLANQWAIARTRGTTTLPVVIVQLSDSHGTTGLGEAAPVARYNESADTVEAFCRKVNPQKLSFEDISGSLAYLNTISHGDMSARCALDVALNDGAAKRSRKTVYDFLGLGFREEQHVTSFTIGIDKPDVIGKKVRAARDYPVLKMKVGSADDKLNLQALRESAPLKTVRVDANEGWSTKEEALKMIEWLAQDRHVEFVEQPMPATLPIKDWAWLKERSPLPVFADESYHSGADAERAAEGCHGVNVKLVKTGGLTAAVEALRTARKAGLKTMLGCMIETSVLTSAAAHLAELCDYLDLDGNLLITNDPFRGVTAEKGILSFATASEKFGLKVSRKSEFSL